MNSLKIDITEINNCMKASKECKQLTKTLAEVNSLIKSDYSLYQYFRIFNYPSIYINDIKYKVSIDDKLNFLQGSWFNKYIRDAVCSALKNPHDIKGCHVNEYTVTESTGFGVGSILLIVFIISLITFFVIVLYRRYINKSMETSLDTKIQTQTIFSLGQYQIFQDSKISKKSAEDSTLSN